MVEVGEEKKPMTASPPISANMAEDNGADQGKKKVVGGIRTMPFILGEVYPIILMISFPTITPKIMEQRNLCNVSFLLLVCLVISSQ